MSEYKQLRKLRWARFAKKPPKFAPQGKRSAAQHAGLRYEAKVLKVLAAFYGDIADVKAKPWIEFQDAEGWGICQPDALIIPHDAALAIVVVEVKLSLKLNAEGKLREFYGPLVRRALKGRKLKYAQVFRNLPIAGAEPTDIGALVTADYEYTTCQLHR